jgi:hypothetical protein
MTLLMGSLAVECWFCSYQDPQPGGFLDWLPQLSSVLWLGGILLLPCYAIIALRSPARSLHDRLVGTYLVPR